MVVPGTRRDEVQQRCVDVRDGTTKKAYLVRDKKYVGIGVERGSSCAVNLCLNYGGSGAPISWC